MVSLVAGTEQRVNTTTAGAQTNSWVADFAAGGHVVVWASGTTVYGQRYDAAGTAVGSQFQANTTAANSPSVFTLSDGSFWVLYRGSDNNAYAQRFNAAGVAQGGQINIGVTATAITDPPLGTQLSNGNVVITYTGTDSSLYGVKARLYDTSGTALAAAVGVNSYGTGEQYQASLSALSGGGFMVTWTSGINTGGQEGNNYNSSGIYAQRYDDTATKVGTETHINTWVPGNQDNPSVAGLSDGGYVVIWQSYESSGSTPANFAQDGYHIGLFLQRYDASGTKVGGEEPVNAYTPGDQFQASVTGLSDGGWVVVWTSQSYSSSTVQDGSAAGVYAQRYDAAGAKVGGELLVAEVTSGIQNLPSVASRPDGGFVVTWTTPDGSSTDVVQRIFADSGAAPVIEARELYVLEGSALAASALVKEGDVQGTNAAIQNELQQVLQYEFRDNTAGAGSGYFVVDGVVQAANTPFTVAADQLDSVRFIAASGNGGDSYSVRAFNGAQWSAWASNAVGAIPLASLTMGDETRVNTTTASAQNNSWVASLAGGGHVAVWMSGNAVMAQRYDAQGQAAGAEFKVNFPAATNASVTGLNDGGFLVVFRSTDTFAYAQRYNADGVAQGQLFTVGQTSALTEVPVATVLSNGNLAVAYTVTDGAYAVRVQVFSPSGDALGPSVLANSYGANEQYQPSISGLAGGGFMVTWTSGSNTGGQENPAGVAYNGSGIYAQRFDNDGAKVGPETHINTWLPGNQDNPSVAGLTDGGYVMVWGSFESSNVTPANFPQDGDHIGLFLQRYDASGTKVGAEEQVNAYTPGDQFQASITGLADGGWVIVWTSQPYASSTSQDGSGAGIYAQRYDASGAKLGAEILVEQVTAGAQVQPSVAARADGGFVISWTTPDAGASTDIAQRVFSAIPAAAVTAHDAALPFLGSISAEALVSPGDHGQDPALTTAELQRITQYQFVDTGGVGGGHFEVNGVTQTQGQAFTVAAADLGSVRYVSGFMPDQEMFQVRAFDGTYWGDWQAATVSTMEVMSPLQASAEQTVNTTITGSQTASWVASLAGGGHVAVWLSGTNVMAQMLDANGNKVGAEFDASLPAASNASVVGLDDGGFLITFRSTDAFAYAQRYSASGVPMGQLFTVGETAAVTDVPVAAALSNGNLAVAYTVPDGAYAVRVQVFSPTGDAWGAPVQANSYGANEQYQASIAALAGGGFVVTWTSGNTAAGQENPPTGTQNGAGIYSQRFDNSGAKVGAETHVNTWLPGNQDSSSVAALSDGGYVVVWTSTNIPNSAAAQDTYHSGVFGQRFDAGGTKVGGEFQVNSFTLGDQFQPVVTGLTDGGWMVAWTSQPYSGTAAQDGSLGGIYGQRYDAAGNPVGGEVLIESVTAGAQTLPSIAARTDGGYVVTWNSPEAVGATATDIVMRGFAGGQVVMVFPVTGTAGSDTLSGGTSRERLEGLGGQDSLSGGGERDILDGGSGHDTLDGGTGDDLLYGGSGDDVLIVDSATDIVMENAGEGTDEIRTALASYSLAAASQTIGSYTVPREIENLTYTGTGSFTGTGSGLNNVLTGGIGNDTLSGGAGNDTLAGGAGDDRLTGGTGNDVFLVGEAGDQVLESAGQGIDEVRATVGSHTLAANVENLTYVGGSVFAGTGNELANGITGGGGNDTLSGGDGADTIDGGGGTDLIVGGTGDDLYLVDSGADSVQEAPGGGIDTVRATTSYSLSGDVENLVLVGSAGYAGTGNGAGNSITGGSGADTLDGGGGTDSLAGGAGNDLYLVDAAGEVSEAGGAGADEVRTALGSYILDANVEVLSYAGVSAFSGTGNGLANWLTGGAGDDTLDGDGGADTLSGGQGNDRYVVDVPNDKIIETAGEGTDEVRTALGSYSLGAELDNLTYTGSLGFAGTGNELANAITGGGAADTLDGGAGADTLTGGAGADTYKVDDVGDRVVEAGGGGDDTVLSSIDLTLADEVETLVLTGAAVSGTGNGLDNRLTGNAGDNALSGGDGADTLDGAGGGDSLTGGAGDDTYIVDAGDQVFEAGGGTDTVRTALSAYALGDDVERLVFTGSGPFTGTGNDLANSIEGGAAADTLDGGLGADSLTGGTGDDSYLVDDAGDLVTELSGEGSDTVITSLSSYTLGGEVEALAHAGTGAFAGTGNGLANSLTGGTGADTLLAAGGADTLTGGNGDDRLAGEAGDDLLTGGAGADLFVYRTGDGADTIQDFTFGDGDRIEIASGMTYTVGSNGAGDAVLDFGAGDTLTLVGRSAGAVDPGWFTTV